MTTQDDLLHAHLQHHWAGAAAGLALFERVGNGHGNRAVATEVSRLAREIDEDREALRNIMLSVGAKPSTIAVVGARAAELVGRLKPNGRIIRRAPLSDVLELEALRTAVYGKRGGWQLLRTVADHDGRLDPHHLDELIRRADEQLAVLHELHLQVARDLVIEGGTSSSNPTDV